MLGQRHQPRGAAAVAESGGGELGGGPGRRVELPGGAGRPEGIGGVREGPRSGGIDLLGLGVVGRTAVNGMRLIEGEPRGGDGGDRGGRRPPGPGEGTAGIEDEVHANDSRTAGVEAPKTGCPVRPE